MPSSVPITATAAMKDLQAHTTAATSDPQKKKEVMRGKRSRDDDSSSSESSDSDSSDYSSSDDDDSDDDSSSLTSSSSSNSSSVSSGSSSVSLKSKKSSKGAAARGGKTSTGPLPTRNADGEWIFPDHKDFRPNMSPKEVLQAGSFGGTYFRPIYSSVTKKTYGDEVWQELPKDWLAGLNIKRQVSCKTYQNAVNTYKCHCGGDLEMWESSGWIKPIDPYGWFQWYCRFFQGRRSSDDKRQIARGLQVFGPKGRWRSNLAGKVSQAASKSGKSLEAELKNPTISPVVRQLLQHWGYRLTLKDLIAYKKRTGK